MEDFNKNIDGIVNKFMDSFQLACSIWVGKHEISEELPDNYQQFFKKNVKFKLVLVIKNRRADG